MQEYIKNRVHELYWNDDINCARTAIICLRLDCMVQAGIGRNVV